MATKFWRGDVPAVRQVCTVQVTAYHASTVYKLTINGKTISVTAQGSVNATASALSTAWNASTIKEFTRVTAGVSTDTVTLTGDTAGEPFTATSSVSGGTGTIGSVTTVTAATGPNNYNDAANWSPSGVPTDGDDIDLSLSTSDILYGLDQSAVAPASWTQPASYTGKIGLPTYNPLGYYEYLDTYLAFSSCALATFGQGSGAGSPRSRLNLGTAAAATVTVYSTGTSESQSLPALLLCGSHASNVLNVSGRANVGLAVEDGTTARFPTWRVAGDAAVVAGAGCTLGGTITQGGGDITFETNVTTLNKTGGTSTQLKAATIGTLTQDGNATHYDRSSGTNTTVTCRGKGSVYDRSRDPRTKTITNGTFTGGAALVDPNKSVTFGNAFTFDTDSVKASNFSGAPFSLLRT